MRVLGLVRIACCARSGLRAVGAEYSTLPLFSIHDLIPEAKTHLWLRRKTAGSERLYGSGNGGTGGGLREDMSRVGWIRRGRGLGVPGWERSGRKRRHLTLARY